MAQEYKSSKKLKTLAFIEGGAVMSIELLTSRFIAPVYGTSLDVWSIILSISILSLTAGYFFGGHLSLKKNNQQILHFLFLISGLIIVSLPILANLIISDFNPENIIIKCSIITFSLTFPILFLLGSTTSIIIELESKTLNDAGKISGKIYSISTIGGVFFTYLTGFYLIPKYGLTTTSIILALSVSLISFITLLKTNFKTSMSIAFLLLIFFFLNNSKNNPNPNISILNYSEGLLGQLLLVDLENKTNTPPYKERALFINRIGQTWVNANTGESRWEYPNYIVSIASTLKPNPSVLVLGLGGGTVPRYLESACGAKVDAIEIDKRMKQIAENYFSLYNTKIIIDDARHYIETTKKKYDLIIFDLYKGESPPSHTLSYETFEKTKQLLNTNGLSIINFNGYLEGETGVAARSIFKTLEVAGFKTKLIPTSGTEDYRNTLFISSLNTPNLKSPKTPLLKNNKPIELDSLTYEFKPKELEKSIVITDDLPILEKLNNKASKKWRTSYYENYTKTLTKEGITIFK